MNFETHNLIKGHKWTGEGQCPQCVVELTEYCDAETNTLLALWNGRNKSGAPLTDAAVRLAGTLGELLWYRGEYQKAWELFEQRKFDSNWQQRFGPLNPIPVVLPDNLAGKTVLVVSEQGLGDNIMFMRYLHPLKARGCRIVFQCRRGLRGIAQSMFACPFDELVLKGAEVKHDYAVALMSLPYAMGMWEPFLGRETGYIETAPDSQASEKWGAWHAGMVPIGHRAIGIMWQGNPQYRADIFRSMQLAMLAPLSMTADTVLINLNVGLGADTGRREPWLISPPDNFDNNADHESCFMDTLALLPFLDCVVSVDTALLHLAGACGVPTYALTTFMPDWRNGIVGLESPWYSRVTILRQPTPGNWVPVIDNLCAELDLAF